MVLKGYQKLAAYGVLIALILLGLIRIILSGGNTFLQLELLGLGVLLVLSVTGFMHYRSPGGERFLWVFFLLYLVNLLLIWMYFQALYVVLLLLAMIGFYLSLPGKKERSASAVLEESQSRILETPHPTLAVAKETSTDKTVASFIPGKFVASRQSNQFHEPKCDWAKKILPERRIWFSSKQEAWEKGFRTHSCVQ